MNENFLLLFSHGREEREERRKRIQQVLQQMEEERKLLKSKGNNKTPDGQPSV